ncbi:MAG: methyl-accepting chemotaxis protein [Treponema sp.]|nr:methyl-accepting chemotaxis protein [Treponema sp.]
MKQTIRRSIFLVSVIVAVLILNLLNLYWAKNYKEVGITKTSSDLETFNIAIEASASKKFSVAGEILKGLAGNRYMPLAMDNEDAEEIVLDLFKTQQNSTPDFLLMYCGYPNGKLILNDNPLPPDFDCTSRSWYINAFTSNDAVQYCHPYIDAITGNIVMTATAPVLVYGQKKGILGIDLSIESLSELMSYDNGYETLQHFVVDAETNEIIIATNKDLIGQQFTQVITDRNRNSCKINGIDNLMTSRINAQTNWMVISCVSRAEIEKPIIKRTINMFLMGTIFFILVFALTSFILGTSLAKPIIKTVSFTKHLSEGEGDLTIRIHTHAKNEVGDLVHYFNQFVESQRIMISDLKKSENDLNLIGQELHSSAQESASSIAQIMANIEGVRRQTESQSHTFEQVINLINESILKIHELDSLITQEADSISDSSCAIEEMVGNINSVTDNVEKMAHEFGELEKVSGEGLARQNEVNEKINRMVEQSKILLDANNTIANVAEQTNLLAMNAAIEAAHAGEAGKGFSVVADEIRKLAENTSDQSAAIGQELQRISATIEAVVDSSDKSRVAFDNVQARIGKTNEIVRIISNAMDEQASASKQVLESLQTITANSNIVKLTASNLEQDSVHIQSSMAELNQVVSTVNGSMDEMAIGAKEINSSAQHISDMANKTQDNINTLNALVGRFITEKNETSDEPVSQEEIQPE